MPDVLTIEEAAALARLDRRTLIAAIEAGKAPGRRIGKVWRVPREAFLAYLAGAIVTTTAGGERVD